MRGTGLMTVVLLGLALAGCGKKAADDGATADGGETKVAAKAADPCSFLTAAEASAITTDKVPEAIRQDDHSCKYRSNPDDGIVVEYYASDGATQMRAMRNAAGLLSDVGASVADKGGASADAAALLKKDGTAAPKLGDEAMWGPNMVLAVRKGDAYVSVMPPIIHDPASHTGYPLVKPEEKRAIAQKAAETILARLG